MLNKKDKMLSMYYKIWADAIAFQQAKQGQQGNWKLFTIISMSVLEGINLLSVLLFIRLLSHKKYPVLFPMHTFQMAGLNTVLSIALTYFAPFIILDYLLIFYNNRYIELQKVYGDKNGKLYGIYALVSIGVIVVPFVFKIIF